MKPPRTALLTLNQEDWGDSAMTAGTLGPAAAPECESEAKMDIQNQQEGICNQGIHRARARASEPQ